MTGNFFKLIRIEEKTAHLGNILEFRYIGVFPLNKGLRENLKI